MIEFALSEGAEEVLLSSIYTFLLCLLVLPISFIQSDYFSLSGTVISTLEYASSLSKLVYWRNFRMVPCLYYGKRAQS